MRVELVKDADGLVDGLAQVLVDCVASGASVGFVGTPRVVGTVRLALATQDNGPHRAEVVKLLVHRDARGKGCASALMAALEDTARAPTTIMVKHLVG
ncbi:GNAT family N-acetyltransferase [Actinokineospora sp.]|uniref:GNAT family N-acetyltransferase n=1 Tax=Actinokineospora sp. TaxID=1872133 RepID=UPI003D6AB27A